MNKEGIYLGISDRVLVRLWACCSCRTASYGVETVQHSLLDMDADFPPIRTHLYLCLSAGWLPKAPHLENNTAPPPGVCAKEYREGRVPRLLWTRRRGLVLGQLLQRLVSLARPLMSS